MQFSYFDEINAIDKNVFIMMKLCRISYLDEIRRPDEIHHIDEINQCDEIHPLYDICMAY